MTTSQESVGGDMKSRGAYTAKGIAYMLIMFMHIYLI